MAATKKFDTIKNQIKESVARS